MQVRVDQLVPYGYTDTAIATFHAFGDRLIREFALELGLPPDVRVLTRPEVVIFLREHLFEFELDEYRPLGDPTRFLGALATLFSRCKDEDVSPDGVPRRTPTSSPTGGPRRDARTTTVARRGGPAPGASWPAPTPATRSCSRRNGLHRLRRPGRASRSGSSASRRPPGPRSRPASATSSSTSSRTRTAPSRSSSSLLAERAPQRDGRRRRRPVDLPLPRRGDQQHPRVPRPLPRGPDGRPAPQLPLARADPRRRPPADPVQRPGPARGPGRDLEAARGRSARTDRRGRRSGSSAFATRRRGGGLDRRRDRPADRGRGARRATTRSSSGRTPRRPDPAQPQRWPAIPWRFSGTSGLYARPEVRLLLAFLRAVADLGLERRRLRRRGRSEPYGLGGEDLTAIVNCARRRNRTLWEVLEELERQPGILRLSRRRPGPRVAPARRRPAPLHRARPRAAGGRGPLRVPARTPGCSPGSRRATRSRPRRQLRNIARFFDIVRPSRRSSPTTGPSFLARHLQTLIEAGDDPADRRPRPGRRRGRGADRPQGEGPRVPGRVPAGPRRRAGSRRRPARAARDPAGARRRGRCRRATSSSRRSAGCSTSR